MLWKCPKGEKVFLTLSTYVMRSTQVENVYAKLYKINFYAIMVKSTYYSLNS